MELLSNVQEKDILFLDIETVPVCATYQELQPELRKLWDKKAAYWMKEGDSPEQHFERAGIYAEFGKVICISVGSLFFRGGQRYLRIKSFAGHDEQALLTEFAQLLSQRYAQRHHYLAAHNGKEFDFPYLARRMLINGIPLPPALDLAGRKPWEVRHIDTLELWKFGDYKNYTSLQLLTTVFGIPTPKDDIDGSEVASVYYREGNLPRIVTYCQKDVVAVVQLFLRYKQATLLDEAKIEYAPWPSSENDQ